MRRLIPSRALLLLAAVPLVVSMLALARPDLARAALLLDAGLLGLALLDGLLSLGLKVNVQRTAPDVMSLGRRNRVALRRLPASFPGNHAHEMAAPWGAGRVYAEGGAKPPVVFDFVQSRKLLGLSQHPGGCGILRDKRDERRGEKR